MLHNLSVWSAADKDLGSSQLKSQSSQAKKDFKIVSLFFPLFGSSILQITETVVPPIVIADSLSDQGLMTL